MGAGLVEGRGRSDVGDVAGARGLARLGEARSGGSGQALGCGAGECRVPGAGV